MTINERVREVRKALPMTLEAFGERIGVSHSAMSNIENGRRSVTDQMARSICREFNVDEVWLRTGVGEMFRARTREEELTEFLADVITEDGFRARFVAVLARLEPDEWRLLEQLARRLLEEQDK